MAKSIRSKWKRKCRAIKRERYGKKELERLKKTLGLNEGQSSSSDVQMKDIAHVINFTTSKDAKQKKDDPKDVMHNMEVEELKNKFNSRTLRDENGAYPVWLHPRKIKKTSKKTKKRKSKGKISKIKK